MYTIGHSTRPIDRFLALLARDDIELVADVRLLPGSRRHPHYDREPLAAVLASHGVAYRHLPSLGGRRKPRADSRNVGWRNASFRGYADHMETNEFLAGLDELVASARRANTAVMCAEAVPWRCHRTLIADALLARGEDVRHILDGSTRPATLTPFACIDGGRLAYPVDSVSRPGDLFDAR
ncbi:MAG: DUF488 domain-containing protein [Gemmatimonadota bacterium]|nr:DUF488 domain-containing protein [Gemmatimonadota bacterium]